MTPLTWLLILTAMTATGQPTAMQTAYFATEAACDAAGDALRGPWLTAKCFPTGMGGMSRLSEDMDNAWLGNQMRDREVQR